MSYALVVGGSPEMVSEEKLSKLVDGANLIVAVDKGMDACVRAHVVPHLFCGDGDSLSEASVAFIKEHHSIETIMYNPMKDDTDLSLALSETVKYNPDHIVVTSLRGGRLDHQLAVVGVLSTFSSHSIWWSEDGFLGRFLCAAGPDAIKFDSSFKEKTVSCISLANDTKITEKNMRWDVERLTLPLLSDRGVSNIVEGESACISVDCGCVLVCVDNPPNTSFI